MQELTERVLDTGYRTVVRPVLFTRGADSAETVHHRTLGLLQGLGQLPGAPRVLRTRVPAPTAPVRVAGIEFPNRVGLAAGMDKDAQALRVWPAFGFGHIEVGTVTALPQPGNPTPRLFRLPDSEAVINRMGFNNRGAEALAARLRATGPVGVPIGVSIGKSKVVPLEQASQDYLRSVRVLESLADYLAVNISSPNTPGLRSLHDAGPLRELLGQITVELARAAATQGRRPTPVLVKVSPDLDDDGLDQVVQVALDSGVAGLIATNTTVSRDGLHERDLPLAKEAGGLSGAPLTRRARYVVQRLADASALPVIGVGGVLSLDDAQALMDSGAQVVQLYSGFIYRGPALVSRLARLLGPAN